jgi:PAS domain S-box-containing protein
MRWSKHVWPAWAPIAALLLAIIGLWISDPPLSFESNLLILVLNFLFSTLVSLYVAYLIGRSFLVRGSLGLLLLGCGIVSWGAAGIVANVVSQGDPSLDVTIHNGGVWLSALFHLVGAIFLLSSQGAVRVPAAWLSAAYVSAAGAVGLIAILALDGYTPTFFVPGAGGSLLRQLVLGSSIGMFLLTALLTGVQRPASAFTYWYALALIAIAVGLFGILLQSTISGLLPWAGRAALYVGGVYMLIAALASVREAKIWGVPLEESLRQATSRLVEVFESISDGFVAVDAHWRYTYVNSAGERILGKNCSELLGKFVWEVFPEFIDSNAFKVLQKANMERTFVEFEDYNTAMQRWFRNRAFPGPDGGITVYFHDITERKQAEEALREAQQQLGAELDAMTRLHALSTRLLCADDLSTALNDLLENAVVACRADFGNIQLYNRQTEALEIIAHRGFGPEFLEHFRTVRVEERAACAEAMQLGERIVIEDVSLDGRFEPHRAVAAAAGFRAVQSTPLKNHWGVVVGMLSTHFRTPHRPSERDVRVLDLYARHAADLIERMRMEQDLRDADRRKDEFLATLAHELRNPLAPLRNAVQLLGRADGNKGLLDQARSIMERQVSQMVRLVDDLLDISRITTGKLHLRKETVELAEVLNAAVETVRPLIEATVHELTVATPPRSVCVQADPTRLAQVFVNLLNNAAKYTETGGHIWLTAERRGDEAFVCVRDNGIGIPEEHLPRLFTMFSQATSALQRSQGGLGIGLALVKGLVELHGGTTEAWSAGPGKGSQFTVRLPIVVLPVEAPAKLDNGEQTSSVPRRRVLVVDDLRDSADSMAMILQMMGHETCKAYDGLEALKAADAFQPNIALLDIGLPKMNGYEVARRIREQPWGGNVALVALTGWGQEEDKRRALEAGFDQHLTKPLGAAELERLLAGLTPAAQS